MDPLSLFVARKKAAAAEEEAEAAPLSFEVDFEKNADAKPPQSLLARISKRRTTLAASAEARHASAAVRREAAAADVRLRLAD
eukprot:2668149-Prymnesium_polylepis.1